LLTGQPQPNGTWTAPDGSPFTGIFVPRRSTPGTSTYTVDAGAPCSPASARVQVMVVDGPTARIVVLSQETCVPATVVLGHTYTGPGTCTWSLGNGLTIQDCAPITAYYNQPGTYDVRLVIDANNACGTDTAVGTITIYAQPVADFVVDPE